MKVFPLSLIITLLFAIPFTGHTQWQTFGGPKAMDIVDAYATASGDIYVTSFVDGLYELKSGEKTWVKVDDEQLLTDILITEAFYFAGSEDNNQSGQDLLRSSDDGQTWVITNFPRSDITGLIYFEGTLYVSTLDDGLYSSTDNGVTWDLDATLKSRQLSIFDNQIYLAAQTGVYSLVNDLWVKLSDLNVNVSALGISSSTIYASSSSDIYKLTLLADSWTALNIGTVEGSINDILPVNDIWYFFGSDELYKIDGGSLELFNTTIGNRTINSVASSGNTIVLGTASGAFLSQDAGASWETINDGFPHSLISKVLPLGDSLLAATNHGVFVSKNEGVDWEPMSSGLDLFRYTSPPRDGIHTFSFSIHKDELFLGAYGAFKYNESSRKWQSISNDISTFDKVLSLQSFNDYLFIAQGVTEVYRYKEGVATKITIGLREVSFPMAFMPTDSGIFLLAYGLNFSENNGDEWMNLTGDDKIYSSITPASNGTILLGTYGRIESYNPQTGKVDTLYSSGDDDDDGWFRDVFFVNDTYLAINEYMDFYLSEDLEKWYRFNAGIDPLTGGTNRGFVRSSFEYKDFIYTMTTSEGLVRRPVSEFTISVSPNVEGTYENSESIHLSWENPDGVSYDLHKISDGSTVVIEGLVDEAYEDLDVISGIEYDYNLVSPIHSFGDHIKPGEVSSIYLPTPVVLDDPTEIMEESFSLSWTTEEPYTKYEVDVFESGDPNTKLTNYDALIVESKSISIVGLSEKISYGVRVRGSTDLGSGSYVSNENYAKTLEHPSPTLGLKSVSDMYFYPNPTNGSFQFRSSVSVNFSEISLLESSGKLILSIKAQSMEEVETVLSKKLSTIESGTYLLQFDANGSNQIWRIVVR